MVLFYSILMRIQLCADIGSLCSSAARYSTFQSTCLDTPYIPRKTSVLQPSTFNTTATVISDGGKSQKLNIQWTTLIAHRLRVDSVGAGLLAIVCRQEAPLLSRARERPLVDDETGISRLLR